MNNAPYLLQTDVYFKKIVRISAKEKFWKFICFAAVIGVIVAAVLGKDALANYDSARSSFFTITSACIWIGIFNTIQSICKEHEIIRSEYRAGMNLASYVMAHVRWQFLLTIMESIVVFVVLLAFGVLVPDRPGFEVGTGTIVGYFVTILLLTFASSLMGLMISAIAGTPTTAMTIMPFVLIVQLVMSGVLFRLEGFSEIIAFITFSKWGMSAFGGLADLNDKLRYPTYMELKLSQPPGSIRTEIEHEFDAGFLNIFAAWSIIIIIAAVCVLIAILSLKLKNRDS